MLGNFTQHLTIMGTVVSVDPSGASPSFTLKTRGGDVVKAHDRRRHLLSGAQESGRS